MSRWQDLNRDPADVLAGAIRRISRPGVQRLTGPHGVTILGPDSDIRWPDEDSEGAPVVRSVRDAVDLAAGAAEQVQTAYDAAMEAHGLASTASTAASDASNTAATAAADAATAMQLAADAVAGASGVVIADTAPIGSTSTLWINTSNNNNTPMRWDGAQWVQITDAAAVAAAQQAAQAWAKAQDAEDAALAAQDAAQAAETKANSAVTASVIEYAVGSSEMVAPTTGWSTSQPARTPGTFVWMRTKLTYGSGSTQTTSAALITGNTGAQGEAAVSVALTATTQVLTSPAAGGATSPSTAVVTGSAVNTTLSVYEYAVDGGSFSAAVPAGVSRSGSIVTITGATMTARTIAVRMASASGAADTLTVAKVADGAAGGSGADAYTVLLSNEAHAFAGSTTAALAGSATSTVMAYKGATPQSATVGTITGQVTGLTTSIASNGTTAPVITITVTTALTAVSGTLTIPITVDGKTFAKALAWTVAREGQQGVSVSSVTTYYLQQAATSDAPAMPTASPPPSPWQATEPAYAPGTALWRTDRVLYSDGAWAYSPVSRASAYDAAIAAMTSANGRNSIITSTAAPSGTTHPTTGNALVVGDTWWRWDSTTTRNIIGQWRWSGSAWQLVQISSEVIANLDVGKLTVSGSAQMTQAVIEHIAGRFAFFKVLTAEVIASGALSVDVEINVGSNLSLDGTHGIRFWAPDPDDPGQQVSLGGMGVGDGGDYWGITDSAGRVVASLGGSGVSAPQGTFDQLTVAGQSLAEVLAPLPRGVIARGTRTTQGADTTAEAGFLSIRTTLQPGRLYRIAVPPHFVTSGIAGTRYVGRLRWAPYPDEAVSTTSDVLARLRLVLGAGAAAEGFSLERYVSPSTAHDVQILYTYASETAGGVYPVPTPETPVELIVEDLGLPVPNTGRIWDNPTPTQPPAQQQETRYTSSWVCTDGVTYRGNNTQRPKADDLQQAWSGQQNGAMYSYALFGGGAVSGETGKTMAVALTGATIESVTIRAHARFWYFFSGGTAIIRPHSLTSLPTTGTPPTGTVTTVTGWPRPGTREVAVNGFTTAHRGVAFGPGSTSTEYGIFEGHLAEDALKPRLTITYRRVG